MGKNPVNNIASSHMIPRIFHIISTKSPQSIVVCSSDRPQNIDQFHQSVMTNQITPLEFRTRLICISNSKVNVCKCHIDIKMTLDLLSQPLIRFLTKNLYPLGIIRQVVKYFKRLKCLYPGANSDY